MDGHIREWRLTWGLRAKPRGNGTVTNTERLHLGNGVSLTTPNTPFTIPKIVFSPEIGGAHDTKMPPPPSLKMARRGRFLNAGDLRRPNWGRVGVSSNIFHQGKA